MRVWLAVLVMATASSSAGAAQEAPLEMQPCNVATEAADSTWRLVRADGFTFCVPPEWSPVGKPGKDALAQRKWRSGLTSIEWTRGRYVPERLPFIVSGEPGSTPRGPPQADIRQTSERIGGGVADMWLSDLQTGYRTGAVWTSPGAIYFLGEARRREQAQVHLDIYRTVRFSLPDGE